MIRKRIEFRPGEYGHPLDQVSAVSPTAKALRDIDDVTAREIFEHIVEEEPEHRWAYGTSPDMMLSTHPDSTARHFWADSIH